ncbi:hypothetical protein OH791_38685 (plasmid) [Streptomyces anulatus]|uniref:hypothetical protein n=1 Tax=Streptomyces anulatus TaxID=1892 RepID=UPI002F906DBF|nr:hypothetical protein OH791_38685 [Streptomyces anulatus]
MDKETLTVKIKAILTHVRGGNLDSAYKGYTALFSDPEFQKAEPAGQRQALELMIMAKGVPSPATDAMIEAHRAAEAPLGALLSAHQEPTDYEMLGVCQIVLGSRDAAEGAFRSGLTIEQQKNPNSALCNTLMKRIAAL